MSRSRKNRRKNVPQASRCVAGEVQQLECRTLPAGTVGIVLTGNNLTITGDQNANDIHITVNNETGVTAQGYVNTSNNGPVNLTKLTFKGQTYKAGESVTLVSAADLATAQGTLGDLTVNMGNGNDKFKLDVSGLTKLKIGGKLSVDLGSGNDSSYVNFNRTNLEVVGDASLTGGSGDDYIGFNGSQETATFDGKLTVDSGAGNDRVQLRWSTVEVKKDEAITTGDGSDNVYQGFNNGGTFGGNVTIDTGNGNDRAYQGFNGATTFKGNVTMNTGNGTDRTGMFLRNSLVTVKGDLTVDTGADNDYVNFNNNGSGSLSVLGNMSILAGEGDNTVKVRANALTIGDASKPTAVKNLNIETGSGSDRVTVDGTITLLTGGVNIATGAGADSVRFVSETKNTNQAANSIAKSLTIDTGNNLALLTAGVNVDALGGNADDADTVYVGFNSDFEVKGNVNIRTFNGTDIVQVRSRGDNNATATIDGDLNVDSGDGSDIVSVTTENAANLLVKGNFNANLDGIANDAPDGEDCFSAGDSAAIDTALGISTSATKGSFTVNKNFTVNAGQGDDDIGLAGINVGQNLTIDANSGDDVIAGFGLQIGGNLTVNGGDGNDQIAAQGTEAYPFTVSGNTTIDTGSGDDTALVDTVTVNGVVKVDLGLGNDHAAASNVTAGANLVSVTIDGGPGTDLGITNNVPNGVVVKRFEGPWNPEGVAAARADIIAALTGCLNTLNQYND